MRASLGIVATSLLLFCPSGCGGDDEATPDASVSIDATTFWDAPVIDASTPDALVADATPADADPNAPDAGPPPDAMLTCTMNPVLDTTGQYATYTFDSTEGYDNLYWYNRGDFMQQLMRIELYYNLGADDGPHTFTFMDENYATCHTCIQIIDFTTGKRFLAIFGTMTITANGSSAGGDAGVTGNVTGSLSDMLFQEVTFETQPPYTSTKVAGGEVWCIPSLSFDALIESA